MTLFARRDWQHIHQHAVHTGKSVRCIRSDLFTSWNPRRGFVHLPRSHRAICLLFVHRNANPSIYPALPACPLRSLCSPHQRYLALFYWQSLLLVLFVVFFCTTSTPVGTLSGFFFCSCCLCWYVQGDPWMFYAWNHSPWRGLDA